jgi:hypothetical protein
MNVLAQVCGVAGAIGMSQFPAFSDAYLQRLGGQNDALHAVVAAFDASAAKAGLTREAALADLSASEFQRAHQADMRDTVARADRVAKDLALLRIAGPLERLALPHRFRDSETLSATWADFRPAVPASIDGGLAAIVGFFAGFGIFTLLWGVLMMPFRKRRLG